MIIALLAASFATITRSDPITRENQAVFGIEDAGSTFGLACKPDAHELAVVFVPASYHGAGAPVPLLWKPRAESRFGLQGKAESDVWSFDTTSLTYSPVVVGGLKRTANFINMLGTDTEFNIRYEAWPDDVRTVTLHYEIDRSALRSFLALCGAQRVNAHLKNMGSPIAP